jgi:regulator of cell morphogenesis and NO signaling
MPTSTCTIRELVSTQSSAAAVLQRFDIDLCSHAEKSLEKICSELQLSVDQVLEKLADAATGKQSIATIDVSGYSMARIIQHIVRAHHQYVRRELPRLVTMAQKLAGKHGERAPELKTVLSLIDVLRSEMLAHLEKEEQILFPFITQMEEELTGGTTAHACFRTVEQPIAMMVREHLSAEGLLAEMRTLTGGFKAPDWACTTHLAFYAGLAMFEADLRQHVHLENDILFPRAIEAETRLNQKG